MCDVEWNVSGMSEISCGLERGVFKVLGISVCGVFAQQVALGVIMAMVGRVESLICI